MWKRVDGERGQEHREVTIARNFRLHCNSALISVPSDKRQAALDSNHSCCQIATPSEIELIAWTNLQSNDAICCSMPWEGLGRQIGGVCGETHRRPGWEVVVFLERLVCKQIILTLNLYTCNTNCFMSAWVQFDCSNTAATETERNFLTCWEIHLLALLPRVG